MTAGERKKEKRRKILESTLYLGKHTFTCKRSDGECFDMHIFVRYTATYAEDFFLRVPFAIYRTLKSSY